MNSTEEQITRSITVLNELGVHARPAARIAQEAQRFEASIFLRVKDKAVDAKSILDILTLAASRGSSVQLEARGRDAAKAVECLERLFQDRFGEGR